MLELGARMSFLIDDQMGAAPSKAEAQFQCKAVVGLLAALGFTLSLSKCQMEPRRVVRLLGMEVDAGAQAFTERECESLARNDFSSTERALRALLYSLRWLQKQALAGATGGPGRAVPDGQSAGKLLRRGHEGQ